MAKDTPATQLLKSLNVDFEIANYDYDPNVSNIGLYAAERLGVSPNRVLKTLIAKVDGKPVCVLAPSDRDVSMKKLAAAFGGKSAEMMKPADAERMSGYKIGGVSAFGQKRTLPTVIEETALLHDRVYMNGGGRGLQVRLDPNEALRVLEAIAAPVVQG